MCTQVVLTAMGLFVVTFMSPGPNLLVVVQAAVTQGRGAGILTGLGVATGDALYAALGLFGMATIVQQGGVLFCAIKIAGGLYLVWFGARMWLAGQREARRRRSRTVTAGALPTGIVGAAGAAAAITDPAVPATQMTPRALYRRGLLTDLGNPQTALFFASVFSVVLTPDTTWSTKIATWVGLVATSLIWRCVVSQAFSLPIVRRGYQRARVLLERITGVALAIFGLRLLYQGLHRT